MTTSAAADAGEALASALGALGFPCRVESRGALALLRMHSDDAARLATSPHRPAALALAKERGFTHVAVEVDPESGEARAAVLRD